MQLDQFIQIMRPAIEAEMQSALSILQDKEHADLHRMLAFHLGWDEDGNLSDSSGKRIRPLLVTLTAATAGAKWQTGLPAAVAVEFVHNFSLIHDDIQDESPMRRGRPSVWKKWGVAQAINAGDTMYSLAHLTLMKLEDTVSVEVANQAAHLLPSTCLALTQGQFLDLAYESRTDLSESDYWPMVKRKTAALIAASTELGAMVAVVDSKKRAQYREFGEFLGLAFQVQDDILGIWGDSTITGKSAESDLVSGKKSYPVLWGLMQAGPFAKRWYEGNIQLEEVEELAAQLTHEGAYEQSQQTAKEMTDRALNTLDAIGTTSGAGEALRTLAKRLLNRQE